MKITLYKPLQRAKFLRDKRRRHYLGFTSMIAYLHAVAPAHKVTTAYTLPELLKTRPDMVGISSVSESWPAAVHAARVLRGQHGFRGPIVYGGPHVSALPETLPAEADCAVVGPGERALAELAGAFGNHRRPDLSQIAGLAFRSECNMTLTPARTPLPLDALPVDVRHAPRETFELSTIRGCPFRCEHCVEHDYQGRVRAMSADKLVGTMQARVAATRNLNFFFQDDTFLAKKGRLREIHDLMRKRGLIRKFKIHLISMNANLVEEDTIPMLRDIGAVKIGMGCESFNPRVLSAMKCGVVKINHLERTLKLARRAKVIPVGGSLVFGYPGETRAEMMDCIRRVRAHESDGSFKHFGCYVCQPLPGSTLWSRMLRQGLVSPRMDFSTLRIDGDYDFCKSEWLYMNEDNIPRAELVATVHKYKLAGGGRFVGRPA